MDLQTALSQPAVVEAEELHLTLQIELVVGEILETVILHGRLLKMQ